jgi:hypothetical protein
MHLWLCGCACTLQCSIVSLIGVYSRCGSRSIYIAVCAVYKHKDQGVIGNSFVGAARAQLKVLCAIRCVGAAPDSVSAL